MRLLRMTSRAFLRQRNAGNRMSAETRLDLPEVRIASLLSQTGHGYRSTSSRPSVRRTSIAATGISLSGTYRYRLERHDRQTWASCWIITTGMIQSPFGTEERDYFGWLPAEITRAVPESVINTIASMVCHAHRKGRKEAYNFLKLFVLEQMRVPDWPHYPMNDLRKMTPPPLPPTREE